MHPPALHDRLEGPLHAGDPDDVHVRVQEQRRAAAGPARDPDGVEAAGSHLLHLDVEPGALQPLGDEPRDLALAGAAFDQVGVDGVDADEVRKQLGERAQYGCTNSTGAPSTSMKPTRTWPKTSNGSAITFPPASASSRLSTR